MFYHYMSELVHKCQGHNSIHVNTNRGPCVQGVETIINICRLQQMYVSQSQLLACKFSGLPDVHTVHVFPDTCASGSFAVTITPGTLRWAAA